MATEQALPLHKVWVMKHCTVGMLAAALLLAGCGVGVNDPEGEAAVGLSPQSSRPSAQEQGMRAADAVNRVAPPSSNTSRSTSTVQGVGAKSSSEGLDNFDSTKALPQDPVPYTPEKDGAKRPGDETKDPSGSEH